MLHVCVQDTCEFGSVSKVYKGSVCVVCGGGGVVENQIGNT